MLIAVALARGVSDGHMQQAAPVMRLLGADLHGPRPAVVQQALQGLFRVLAGQQGNARHVLFPRQLMQAAAQGGVGPPRAQRGHEAQLDGIFQAADARAGIVAGGRVYPGIHASKTSGHGRKKKVEAVQRFHPISLLLVSILFYKIINRRGIC